MTPILWLSLVISFASLALSAYSLYLTSPRRLTTPRRRNNPGRARRA